MELTKFRAIRTVADVSGLSEGEVVDFQYQDGRNAKGVFIRQGIVDDSESHKRPRLDVLVYDGKQFWMANVKERFLRRGVVNCDGAWAVKPEDRGYVEKYQRLLRD